MNTVFKTNTLVLHDETHQISSTVAFLAGVDKRIFENEFETLDLAVFNELIVDKSARMIRNLCRVRTKLEQNFCQINHLLRYEMRSLASLGDLIPQDALIALESDGIYIMKANQKTNQYIIDINKHISNHLYNCKSLFPLWVNWDYIRDLFIMPKGTTEAGIKRAAAQYYAHIHQYPYQVYLNWIPGEYGNIFFNDKKFLRLLYTQHNDRFIEFSKVTDATGETKDSVYHFIADGSRTIIVIDCENADPYRFYGMLENLDQQELLTHVAKIILYNDVNASSAWKQLSRFTQIPVEHNMTERIKSNKSLVDIQLAVGVCKEFYENAADSIILVSSDSDYWGMISMLPNARFFVIVEREKCSPATTATLKAHDIPYCNMDLFCMASSYKIATQTLLSEVQMFLQNAFKVNMFDVLEEAYRLARLAPSDAEKQRFYDRYIRSMRITFSETGIPEIQLG